MKKFLVTFFITTISLSGLLIPAISHAQFAVPLNMQQQVKEQNNNAIINAIDNSSTIKNLVNNAVRNQTGETNAQAELRTNNETALLKATQDGNKAAQDVAKNGGSTQEQNKAREDKFAQSLATSNNTNNSTYQQQTGEKNDSSKCGVTRMDICLKETGYWIINVIGNSILKLCALILAACGSIFDLAMTWLVVGMKERVTKITAISEIWKTSRDIANMFFIFILLALAIQTILDKPAAKKLIVNVVLVALFINFSFFFTSLLIDFSNMTAMQFYKGFNTNGSLTTTITDALHIGSVYDSKAAASGGSGVPISAGENTVYAYITTVIMGAILMIVIAGVFLASAILLVYRFIELIMLLMFSPLAFAAWILPSTKKYQGEWWSRLYDQLIFAPVYFMFLWMCMKIISNKNLFPDGSLSKAFNGTDAAYLASLVISYIIAITMFSYSLILAKKLGAKGTDMATSASKGLQGWVGRNTVGRAASRLDKAWMKNTSFLGGTGFIGSKLRNITTNKLANETFGSKTSFVDYQKADKARIKAKVEQARTNKNEADVKAGLEALKVDASTITDPTKLAEHEGRIQKLANYAKTASTKDLTAMKSKDLEALAEAGMLTPDKMSAILDDKNENHNSAEKDKVRKAYSKKVNEALDKLLSPTATPADRDAAKTAISNLGEEGMKIVDPELTSGRGSRSTTFIQMTSGKQYKKILENTYGDGKNKIRDARFEKILDPATPDTELFKLFGGLDGADMAHLLNNAKPGTKQGAAFARLKSDEEKFVNTLDPRKLTQAWSEEGLNPLTATEVREIIEREKSKTPPNTKAVKLSKHIDTIGFAI